MTEKIVTIASHPILTIMLSGEEVLDRAAILALDFKKEIGIDVPFPEKILEKGEHNAETFFVGPQGIFAHSLQSNKLIIYEQKASVEDLFAKSEGECACTLDNISL